MLRVGFDLVPVIVIFAIAFGVFLWLGRDSFKYFLKRKDDGDGDDAP